MKNVTVTRTITDPDAFTALDAALRTALGAKCDGFTSDGVVIVVKLQDNASPTDETTAATIVTNFDPATRTTAQQALATRKADFQSLVTGAQQAISDLNAEIAILQGPPAPTNAQILAALIANEQRQRNIIKAILRIADAIT